MLISGKSEIVIDQQFMNKEIQMLLSNGNSAKSVADKLFKGNKINYSKKEIYKLVNKYKGLQK